jgi:hypothetical protein
MTKIQMTHTVWRIFPLPKHRGGRLFLSLGHSDLGFVSDFDIRISELKVIPSYTAQPLKHDHVHRTRFPSEK